MGLLLCVVIWHSIDGPCNRIKLAFRVEVIAAKNPFFLSLHGLIIGHCARTICNVCVC